MKKPGRFSETVACPLCGARVFVGYKGRDWLLRCLDGHIVDMRWWTWKVGISDDGAGA